MRVVYIDTLFIINTVANFLLLTAASKICDVFTGRLRIIAAAVLGGIYAVFAALPSFEFLNTLFVKGLFSAVMVLLAFGTHRSFFRILVIFISVSAALGGIIYAVSLGTDGIFTTPGLSAIALSFLCAAGVITLAFRRSGKPSGKTHKISVEYFGKSSVYTAFVDTGNSLKDPISGKPVIIIGVDDLSPVLPGELYKLLKNLTPTDFLQALSGTHHAGKFRLLPYSAVGVKSGMLPAMRAEVKIDGTPAPGILIAISPTSVSDGGAYSALIGL